MLVISTGVGGSASVQLAGGSRTIDYRRHTCRHLPGDGRFHFTYRCCWISVLRYSAGDGRPSTETSCGEPRPAYRSPSHHVRPNDCCSVPCRSSRPERSVAQRVIHSLPKRQLPDGSGRLLRCITTSIRTWSRTQWPEVRDDSRNGHAPFRSVPVVPMLPPWARAVSALTERRVPAGVSHVQTRPTSRSSAVPPRNILVIFRNRI